MVLVVVRAVTNRIIFNVFKFYFALLIMLSPVPSAETKAAQPPWPEAVLRKRHVSRPLTSPNAEIKNLLRDQNPSIHVAQVDLFPLASSRYPNVSRLPATMT